MKLKPCPFCGVVPEVEETKDFVYDIKCYNMHCEIELTLKNYAPSEEEAVKFWNKRSK